MRAAWCVMNTTLGGDAMGEELKALPKGLFPVMLMPFAESGEADWEALERLTDFYIDAGATGLFANCLSSDFFQLTPEERLEMARKVVNRADGRVPAVAAATFGDDADGHVDFARRMADTGVSALVVVTNQLASEEEPEEAFLERLERFVEATAPLPLGLYECPTPTKRLLSADAVRWAGQTGRFLYMKETSGGGESLAAKIEAARGTNLGIYNAHNLSALNALRDGAAGLSPIMANFVPEVCAWLCANWDKDPDEAERVQRWLALVDAAIGVQYPASARWFLRVRGLDIPTGCRSDPARPNNDDAERLGHLAVAFRELCVELSIVSATETSSLM